MKITDREAQTKKTMEKKNRRAERQEKIVDRVNWTTIGRTSMEAQTDRKQWKEGTEGKIRQEKIVK